jgi:hypothetical protein
VDEADVEAFAERQAARARRRRAAAGRRVDGAAAERRLRDREQVAGRAEVGSADERVVLVVAREQALPLEAEVGGVVAGHFDDQAFDVDLRTALVELVDHRAHLPVERLGRGDDE